MVQRIACCVLLLTVLGEAQTPATQPERAPTLHDAWLFEVLDLDVEKAVAAYEKVAADTRPGNLDRWVAVARLAELKRLGVAVKLHVDPKEIPELLRAPLESIKDPLPVADLLQRVHGDPEEVLKRLGTEAGRLPSVHPVTRLAEDWRLQQFPRVRQPNNLPRPGQNRSTEAENQDKATDILRTELAGWRSPAAARRARWFPDWLPPRLPGDPLPWLEKFRINLEASLRDPDQAPQTRNLLRDLRDVVNEKAATDPEAALALVARLPLYAEKLLGLTPAANR